MNRENKLKFMARCEACLDMKPAGGIELVHVRLPARKAVIMDWYCADCRLVLSKSMRDPERKALVTQITGHRLLRTMAIQREKREEREVDMKELEFQTSSRYHRV